ncbi:MAG: aminopeptidase N [Candidatus Competibacteraceae bacterium]|jgi:aminopeptidase N|nr:aminopeptidase N [Candidatus Competibacteraceae bacterium]
MNNDSPRAIHLKDYTPPPFLIDTVDLRFELGEDATLVHSRMAFRRNPEWAEQDSTPLVLAGQQLELIEIRLDGRTLTPEHYTVDADHLTLSQVPSTFELEITTRIYPQNNTALEGLYQSSGNFCTQCEAEGFRKITYFLDRPDVMAVYTTTVVADKTRYPVLLSNGNLVDSGELAHDRHWATWHDPFKKPSYLFALVAGHLRRITDTFTTLSGREVALHIYVEPENIDQCDHAMASLKKAMAWDEATFGREYDLGIYMIVAVGDFNMGAMENKGLNVFNTKYVLAKPETATDADYQGIEGVIGHEYFHNWTGNRITCRDWFQLSLKEGLTVFRDQEFTADMSSRPVKRIDDVRILRSVQFPQDAGPMAHPVRPDSYIEINNFYTVTVYNKGAEVIRMMQTLLGRAGFRRGMDLYFERHDGQAVTTDDFVKAMEDANGVDWEQFRRWYTQAGTPEVNAEGSYDAADNCYTLTLRQSCPPTPGQDHKEPFHIPVALGLLDSTGRSLPLQLDNESEPVGDYRVLELRTTEQQFRFINVPDSPLPSLLRGFSAPVKLLADYSDDDLMFLLAHDSDPFNRWEAGQQLTIRTVLRLVEDRQRGRSWDLPEAFSGAFGQALATSNQDPALLARILTSPDEIVLAEHMDVVDVDGIHEARQFVQRVLAERLREHLAAVYATYNQAKEYRIDADSMGQRSLKNRCLDYLMQLDDPEWRQRCLQQFQSAANMTDQLGALGLLVNFDCSERSEALVHFEQHWGKDPLVMDKWFSLQAMSRLPGTLSEVNRLMAHPAFTIKNPNKVRALIGAFCHSNPFRFHAADGAGYAFLSEQVLTLNAMNPQIAARLVGAFTRWRKYDANRQALMKAELERILATPDLSPDVYEIVAKSLG